MLKLVTIISLIGLIVFGVFVTPEPIRYNTVQITWQTQPDTTWINIWNTNDNYMQYAARVSPGVTNTLALEAVEGVVFQIQEYRLVNGSLELITFFNLAAVPHSDFPTPTQTPQPTQTPVPTNTPIPNTLKVQVFAPIVTR